MIELNVNTTALVVIDLQKGTLSMDLAPHPANQVLETARKVCSLFRDARAAIVQVHVEWSADKGDMLKQLVDRPMVRPAGFPANFSEFADGLVEPGDLIVTKKQWGAFYGTDLDLQLRRRSIQTIVLGGIATNFGVESTARSAFEHGYEIVFLEDMMSSVSAELHKMSVEHVFPRIGRISRSDSVRFKVA